MFIFVEPDELRSNSRFPSDLEIEKCEGLEELTGADFVLSASPINPIDDPEWHIENRSYFVQRKSGFDVVNFDHLWNGLARMKKLGVAQSKAILLFIGVPDNYEGSLSINEGVMSNVSYRTFKKLGLLWGDRGGFYDEIAHEDLLGHWIEAAFSAMEEDMDRVKYIYPNNHKRFQQVEEVAPEDTRAILCALPGIGPTLAQNIADYMDQNGYGPAILSALMCLTLVDDKNKMVHKIPGFGAKSSAKLRYLMGLSDGANIAVTLTRDDEPFIRGANAALAQFVQNINRGMKGKDAMEATAKMVNEFYVMEEGR